MKTVKIFITCILIYHFSAWANSMENQELPEQLQLLILPTSEDEAYLDKYVKLCSCVINKARETLSSEQLNELSYLLNEFSNLSHEALNNIEVMLKNGPPRPSQELMTFMEKLENPIESCEQKLGISVEF